jgi:hypothetical protein
MRLVLIIIFTGVSLLYGDDVFSRADSLLSDSCINSKNIGRQTEVVKKLNSIVADTSASPQQRGVAACFKRKLLLKVRCGVPPKKATKQGAVKCSKCEPYADGIRTYLNAARFDNPRGAKDPKVDKLFRHMFGEALLCFDNSGACYGEFRSIADSVFSIFSDPNAIIELCSDTSLAQILWSKNGIRKKVLESLRIAFESGKLDPDSLRLFLNDLMNRRDPSWGLSITKEFLRNHLKDLPPQSARAMKDLQGLFNSYSEKLMQTIEENFFGNDPTHTLSFNQVRTMASKVSSTLFDTGAHGSALCFVPFFCQDSVENCPSSLMMDSAYVRVKKGLSRYFIRTTEVKEFQDYSHIRTQFRQKLMVGDTIKMDAVQSLIIKSRIPIPAFVLLGEYVPLQKNVELYLYLIDYKDGIILSCIKEPFPFSHGQKEPNLLALDDGVNKCMARFSSMLTAYVLIGDNPELVRGATFKMEQLKMYVVSGVQAIIKSSAEIGELIEIGDIETSAYFGNDTGVMKHYRFFETELRAAMIERFVESNQLKNSGQVLLLEAQLVDTFSNRIRLDCRAGQKTLLSLELVFPIESDLGSAIEEHSPRLSRYVVHELENYLRSFAPIDSPHASPLGNLAYTGLPRDSSRVKPINSISLKPEGSSETRMRIINALPSLGLAGSSQLIIAWQKGPGGGGYRIIVGGLFLVSDLACLCGAYDQDWQAIQAIDQGALKRRNTYIYGTIGLKLLSAVIALFM